MFADPFAVYLDDGSEIGTLVVIGTSIRDRVLYVVHVQRGPRDRIIGARPAERGERAVYESGANQMSHAAKRRVEQESDPVRVLGRGLRAQRGIHLTLRGIREAAGRTQVEVKEASGIDQGDISRLEGRPDFEDCQVGTLQRYVAALGGHLDLVAVFNDKRITLAGMSKSGESPANQSLQRTGTPQESSRKVAKSPRRRLRR